MKKSCSHVYEFSTTKNSQSANAPTIVLSVGDERIISMYETEPTKKTKMSDNFKFKLKHGSLFILHPDDEVPACRSEQDLLPIFKHGNVTFGGETDNMNIAFVFRNTSKTGLFHRTTGHLLIPSSEMKVCKDYERTQMLKSFKNDPLHQVEYHNKLVEAHSAMPKSYFNYVSILGTKYACGKGFHFKIKLNFVF